MNTHLDESQNAPQRFRPGSAERLRVHLQLNILSKLAQLGVVLLVMSGVLAVVSPPPSAQRLTLGAPGDERIAERFWQPESNGLEQFRWTNGASFINLNDVRGVPLIALSLRIASPKSTAETPRDVTLWTVGQSRVGIQVEQTWRVYHLLAQPARLPWQASGTWLFSATERAASDDNRAVGVILSDVRITPIGERSVPFGWQALFGLTALILGYCWSLQMLPARYALMMTLALGLLAIAIWLARPDAIAPHIVSIWRIGLVGSAALAGGWLVWAAPWSRLLDEHRSHAALRKAQGALLVLLSVFLGLFGLLSLQWRMTQDSPLLFYFAYAIDQLGMVPYRDLFEQNLPLTYAIYMVVGKLSGYSDIGFRLADLLYLAAIGTVTWIFMRRFGRQVAWIAAVLFAILYLGHGAVAGMQREYLMILPLALTLRAASSSLPHWRKVLLASFCFGLSVAIKPQALIAFPAIALFLIFDATRFSKTSVNNESSTFPLNRLLRRATLTGALATGGVLLPLAASIVWLSIVGGLDAFVEMWRAYLPLFAQLSGTNQLIEGPARTAELVQGYFSFGGHAIWFPAAVCGVICALRWRSSTPVERRFVLLLVTLTLCYSLYTVVAGRFWYYHWFLFLYCLSLLVALGFGAQRAGGRLRRWLPLALLLATVLLEVDPPPGFEAQAHGRSLPPPSEGRADQIASYLSAHLRPGDTVQPLDWSGGVLHGMLLARAPIASPFVYDIQFYHHVSDPYIQELRRSALEHLDRTQPRFIVELTFKKPWIPAPGSGDDFPELREFLSESYELVVRGAGYALYERSGS